MTVTGVKVYRNWVTYVSQVMKPQGPLLPCTPQMLPSKHCQRWPIETWKRSYFGVWTRGHCLFRHNPYLERNAWKKLPFLNCQSIYAHLLWKQCRRDTYCIERVNKLWTKRQKNNTKWTEQISSLKQCVFFFRTSEGIRNRLVAGEQKKAQYTEMILTGWDYAMYNEKTIEIKKKALYREALVRMKSFSKMWLQ